MEQYMNLVNGHIVGHEQGRERLEELEQLILEARQAPTCTLDMVVQACDALSQRLNEGQHLPLLVQSGMPLQQAKQELTLAKQMLSAAYLQRKIHREFCDPAVMEFTPLGGQRKVRQERRPLGVLLHIAAGNLQALPAFSVIEGLLAGNINVLKLPGEGDALSLEILRGLSALEPRLSPFIFAFTISSKEEAAMERMAGLADGIAIWGSDAAVQAVRRLAPPNVRIIEWGHKISFAYVGKGYTRQSLQDIARHICHTNQLLCSACQGLYIDTNNFAEAAGFAKMFAEVLQQAAAEDPFPEDPFLTAKKTLEIYTEELESAKGQKRVFRAHGCSVIAYPDSKLEPAYQMRNCWVKPLPREKILQTLTPHKGHLQTVALLCGEAERDPLFEIFKRTGAVRVTDAGHMSCEYSEMPHDGRFPLREYSRYISSEL